MKNILIIGAASAIAEATARVFAQRGDSLFLVARNQQVLESIGADLKVRGARTIGHYVMDVNDFAAHERMLQAAEQSLGTLDVVLLAYGTLSDQPKCESSVELMVHELTTNGVSVAALLTRVSPRLEARKAGTIVVISSVAGERGRQSNYVYGSAKALVTAFTSGLRQRLYKSGIAVITIKPGFVDTPMTAALAKKGVLWAKPEAIAAGIVHAVDRGGTVRYLPGFWRWIMWVICNIPETIFRRLKL